MRVCVCALLPAGVPICLRVNRVFSLRCQKDRDCRDYRAVIPSNHTHTQTHARERCCIVAFPWMANWENAPGLDLIFTTVRSSLLYISIIHRDAHTHPLGNRVVGFTWACSARCKDLEDCAMYTNRTIGVQMWLEGRRTHAGRYGECIRMQSSTHTQTEGNQHESSSELLCCALRRIDGRGTKHRTNGCFPFFLLALQAKKHGCVCVCLN